jgi:CRP/FNR family transcriptional regulator, anaerobic regulatory protein
MQHSPQQSHPASHPGGGAHAALRGQGLRASHPPDSCCGSCPISAVCDDVPGGIPSALLESVLDHRQLEAGATLYMAGQKRCSVWVVSAGALKTCEVDVEGHEQVVGFHVTGDILGLERLEIPEHRGFALALEPTTVCRIPVTRLVARLSASPELWRDLLGLAGQQIARAREIHRILGQLQTGQRLAWFLLQADGPRRNACACSGDSMIHLPMQRQDIASYLGMTLETVSRSFSALHKEGLIEVHGRTVRLLDPARLAARIAPQQRAAA